MRNPLAAHPPWRQLALASIGLPIVVTLAIMAFTWPAARMAPRSLPVGVVGTTPASQQLATQLLAKQPGAFELRLYTDTAAAEAAVRTRAIYGAFAITPGRITVLDASAAGPAVAQLLDTVGGRLVAAVAHSPAGTGQPPTRLAIVDVVPLAATDAKGVVFSSALLPLTICSIILASAIGLVVRFRPAWRQLVALTASATIAALGVYLVAQGWLGTLPHDGLQDWGSLALTILALSAATAGLIALVGAPGLGVAALLFVFVGNPFSGVTSAPQLLPTAVDHLGQWLPPGAGASLLRSTAYFNGNGAGGHVAVLAAWALGGFAAIVIGHHAPIRFAAARIEEPSHPPPSSRRQPANATG
jgi:hypothetical protein